MSVVVPVLDESARMGVCLDSLRRFAPPWEVLVVDGGSDDGTAAIAAAHDVRARVLQSSRGRGPQCNAGARAASGDVLLFLHADVTLPDDAPACMEEALSHPAVVAGAFRTWHVPDGGRSWLSPLLHVADVRSRISRLPLGDQAIFVRADAFARAGGFPDIPLMEDVVLSHRLSALGRIRTVPHRVRVSGRRILRSPVRAVLAYNLFPVLYRMGVAPATLARLYGNVR